MKSIRLPGGLVGSASLALLWTGFLLGTALSAAVKFQAPSLSLAVGVDVGRHVFTAVNRTELVLAVMAVVLLICERPGRLVVRLWTVALAALALETALLLPALERRAELFMAGIQPPSSWLHTALVVLVSIKVVALLMAGHVRLRSLRRSWPVPAGTQMREPGSITHS